MKYSDITLITNGEKNLPAEKKRNIQSVFPNMLKTGMQFYSVTLLK